MHLWFCRALGTETRIAPKWGDAVVLWGKPWHVQCWGKGSNGHLGGWSGDVKEAINKSGNLIGEMAPMCAEWQVAPGRQCQALWGTMVLLIGLAASGSHKHGEACLQKALSRLTGSHWEFWDCYKNLNGFWSTLGRLGKRWFTFFKST